MLKVFDNFLSIGKACNLARSPGNIRQGPHTMYYFLDHYSLVIKSVAFRG